MIIKSNSIILATDLSPAFIPTSEFLAYKKGLYPLAIVNSLSFNVQNSRIQKKQLSSQSLSVNALQYSPTVDVSFNYTSSLAFENENFLGIYFRANADYASSFLNSNAHSCNLYFIISDLYAEDLIKHIQTRGNLNGLTTICFGNCFLSSYSLSLQATDLPSVSAQMQAVNMEMKTISSSTIFTPAINLAAGDQIGGAPLSINNALFIEHLQRLNTQTGNFPILPTRDSLYFQMSNQNLQVPSVKISPSEDSAINSLELSFGIERENSYGFGSDFIYDSKIKYPILGSLNLSATSLNLHTGDGSLTGTMKSEQDYSLELMFSGVNENSKFVKINNAKLESHSYQMDYAGVLSAQYAFNFECNEATGIAVKWGQETGHSTGVLFSFENLQLRSSDGSGLYAESTPPLSYVFNMAYSSDTYENACSVGAPVTCYSYSNVLGVGSILYQDIYLTNPVPLGYYSYNNDYYSVIEVDGQIENIGGCPPPESYTFSLAFNDTIVTDCNNSNSSLTSYSNFNTIIVGEQLFTDPYLSIPVPSRRYREGNFLYDIVSGFVTNLIEECYPEPSVGDFTFLLQTSSGPSVDIGWSSAENATGYAIFQSEDSVSYSQIYSGDGVYSYNDSSVVGGGEYPNYYFYYMVGFSGASNYTTSAQNIGVE